MTLTESTKTTTALPRFEDVVAPLVAERAAEAPEPRELKAARYVFGVARITIGSVFLWAFADKLVGLDHSTPGANSWLHGGSPTSGFLKGVSGPFADQFHSIAGSTWADYLFMIGLLGIGLALVLGIGMRIAATTGSLLLVFMWAASLPIKTHPFVDDHLIYALVIVGMALSHAGDTLGLGKQWSRTRLVKRFPILR